MEMMDGQGWKKEEVRKEEIGDRKWENREECVGESRTSGRGKRREKLGGTGIRSTGVVSELWDAYQVAGGNGSKDT